MTELTFKPAVDDEDVDPLAPDDDAPYGYTFDRVTGERRPKLKAGRNRKAREDDAAGPPDVPTGEPPSIEALKAGAAAKRTEDRPPEQPKSRATRRGGSKPKAAEDAPPFRAGPIAKGMNKLYAKTGKIVRVFDAEIGQAFIDATRKESDDDVTVGEAWEELARVNPRVRKFLMKLISGGAWSQLVMAHMPILLAVILKPAVIKHVPFHQLIQSLAEPDDDTPAGEGGLPGGMTEDDAAQMTDMARQHMARLGLDVDPALAAQMAEMAAQMGNGAAAPAAVRQERHQPRRSPARAKR
jgi:hypothetical protein